MGLRLDAVGKTTSEHVHEYTERDVMLYALGVGAKAAELDYLYEGRGPLVLPTYAVVPAWPALTECFELLGAELLGVVHGGQSIKLHRPFAPSGRLSTTATIEGLYDLKRLATGVVSTKTVDESGELIAETTWTIVFRFDGGFGGDKPPKRTRIVIPEGQAPLFTWEEKTSPEQALLYRLSGDRNPLHADPEVAAKAGFDAPILHGLCSYGFLGRAVIHSLAGGDPTRLLELEVSFQAPILPGETLRVAAHALDDERIALVMTTLERPDEIAVGNAFARLAPATTPATTKEEA